MPQEKTFRKLVANLKTDDELVIKSIDRLGRNYDEILEQWQLLTKKKKVHITVLDFPLLNTKKQSQHHYWKADLRLSFTGFILCFAS